MATTTEFERALIQELRKLRESVQSLDRTVRELARPAEPDKDQG